MKSLKDGFIEYLNEKYIEIVENDVSTYLKRKYSEEQEIKGIITALSALDSDLEEFQFKIKFEDNSGEIFILEYTCVLDNGIKDLKCITCSENKNGRFEYMNNLSSCFVPFMYRDKYDIFAKRFLDNCVGDEFKGYPVNVLGISSNMGLQMIYAYNIPSMGCTVFKDCKMNLRTADGILSLKSLKKGTIIISVGNILKTGNLSLSNSTVIHECIHWYYHRKAFEILMLLNDEYSYLECKDYDSTDAINKAFNFMEIQANALTPIILMDKDCVISELKEAMAMIENDKELNDLPRVNKFNRICSEVANTFQTSLNSTVKRLVSLGYEEFKVLENKNGVDDFIPTSSSDKLPENKTRCINKDQYRFLMKTNKTFSFLINNDICVYTNGYVVMNSKKYLDGEYPVQRLNVYARDHIDECSTF